MGDKSNLELTTVHEAIAWAETVLPGAGADDEFRWRAVIAVAKFIESNPEEVWRFVVRWGDRADEDLRDAIACCVLEHLLEYHFESIFPRVEQCAETNPLFADMFGRCWKFGQSALPKNCERIDKLRFELGIEPQIS
jgi:hypothetical protein